MLEQQPVVTPEETEEIIRMIEASRKRRRISPAELTPALREDLQGQLFACRLHRNGMLHGTPKGRRIPNEAYEAISRPLGQAGCALDELLEHPEGGVRHAAREVLTYIVLTRMALNERAPSQPRPSMARTAAYYVSTFRRRYGVSTNVARRIVTRLFGVAKRDLQRAEKE